MSIQTTLNAAMERRRGVLAELHAQRTDCYRLLCEGEARSKNLVIDIYGGIAILHLYEPRSDLEEISRAIAEAVPVKSVYAKAFVKDRSGQLANESLYASEPVWGEKADPEFLVQENGLKFWIRPYAGFSTGLFLDQRANRKKIQTLAENKRVLNLFSYTCGFSVCAAVGRASEITSVDVSKKYLAWGKQNFEANQLQGHRFIAEDAIEYLRRVRRRKEYFDLVIVDPPSFGRSEKGSFSLSRDLPVLIESCLQVTKGGGRVFISTNHRELISDGLQRLLPAKVQVEPLPPTPEDFAASPNPLAACLFTVSG